MAWRDTLRTASFRGVTFYVDNAETEVGRRGVRHEYPQRDEVFVEDMGRKPRRFSLDAYVIGADYHLAREAMLDACEKEGAGELVHPYLGTKTVLCVASVLKESKDEGGMARFTLTFEETTEAIFPAVSAHPEAAVEVASDDAVAASKAKFEDRFSVTDLPQFVTDEAADLVGDLTDAMQSAFAPVVSLTSDVAALNNSLDLLAVDATTLVRTPGQLFDDLSDAFRTLSELPNLPGRSSNSGLKYAALRSMFTFGDDRAAIPEGTTTREQQAENEAALLDAVHQLALFEAARVGVDLVTDAVNGTATVGSFDSLDALLAVRDELADGLDTEAEATDDDDLFQALGALRARTVGAIPGGASDLSRLVTYTPVATLPALALAHLLYQDAERSDELVARNNIRHPMFVLGGRAIKALADDQ